MSDISRLAKTLMKLDDKLADCMRCGLCQAVCPVFGVTHKEGDVTRGKLALLDNLAHKIIQDPDAVEERLNRCLLCGSCQANCPSGVSIMEIFVEARQALVDYRGLNPIKKLVFRELLTHPQLFSAAMRTAAPFQGLVMRQQGAKTYDMPLLSKLVGSRHIAKLPAKSLHAKYGRPAHRGSDRHQGPVLRRLHGRQVLHPARRSLPQGAQTSRRGRGHALPSSPAAAFPLSLPATARASSWKRRKTLKSSAGNSWAAASTTWSRPAAPAPPRSRKWWPYFYQEFSPDQQKTVRAVADRVMDINAFLVDVLHVDQMEPGERHPGDVTRVTFHDSCHLKKSVGVSEQPRKLIRMNPNYELVEMAEADRCCGCGGSFTLFHYDLSKEIGQRKRDNIVRSGASVVATGCPACMLQISDMLSQNKDEVQVKHPIEIYAETLPD